MGVRDPVEVRAIGDRSNWRRSKSRDVVHAESTSLKTPSREATRTLSLKLIQSTFWMFGYSCKFQLKYAKAIMELIGMSCVEMSLLEMMIKDYIHTCFMTVKILKLRIWRGSYLVAFICFLCLETTRNIHVRNLSSVDYSTTSVVEPSNIHNIPSSSNNPFNSYVFNTPSTRNGGQTTRHGTNTSTKNASNGIPKTTRFRVVADSTLMTTHMATPMSIPN